MSFTIKVKRGLYKDLPTAVESAVGEFRYCTDTQELYIVAPDNEGGYINKLVNASSEALAHVLEIEDEVLTGKLIYDTIKSTKYPNEKSYILNTKNEGTGIITVKDDTISGMMVLNGFVPYSYYFIVNVLSTSPIVKQETLINSATNPVSVSKPIPYYTTSGMEGLGLVKNAAVWESAGDKDIVTKLAVDEQINNKIGTGDLKIYVKDPSFEGDPACTFNANSDTDVKFNIDTASKANEVDYTTTVVEHITNVEEALDSLFDKTFYEKLSINSFNGGNLIKEVGDKVEGSLVFSWSYKPASKIPTTQTLKMGSTLLTDDVNVKSYTLTLDHPITTQTAFTLSATDEKGAQVSKVNNIVFQSKRFWGVTPNETITDEEIFAFADLNIDKLGKAEFCTSRNKTITLDCTGGRYIWYIFPTKYASGMTWKDNNGLSFSDYSVETRDLTNIFNITENYTICRVINKQTGNEIKYTIS